MPSIPVVFLAFANDKDAYLSKLRHEERAIREALAPLEDQGRIKVHSLGSTAIEDIFTDFDRFGEQIVIFHFGGHASGTHLQLEGQAASASGLAQRIQNLPHLQWVFLNGCSTRAQVEALLALGVKAVIATHEPVEDEKALQFATQFYRSLANKASLQIAFANAKAYLETKEQVPSGQIQTHRVLGSRLPSGSDSEAHPWGLFVQDAKVETWKFPKKHLSRPLLALSMSLTVIIVMLIYLFARPARPFDVTIFLQSENEPLNQLIKNRQADSLTLDLGADRRTKVIIDGEVSFREIPAQFAGKKVPVRLSSRRLALAQTNQLQLDQKNLYLKVKRNQSLAIIQGVVRDENNQPLPDAIIQVQDFKTKSNALGEFELIIPETAQQARQKVIIYKEGHEIWEKTLAVSPDRLELILKSIKK